VALVLPVLLLLALLAIPLGELFSGRRRLGYEIGRTIMKICFVLTGVRFGEIGRERVEPFRTRVYMVNHESLVDMPYLLSRIPGANTTLIKKEAFRVPLVGQAFRAVGFIAVDRSSLAGARESVSKAREILSRGYSVVIAPEGTRSRTGKLGRFRSGGFRIAVAAGVPIAPVSMVGAREIMPPGSWLIRPGTVRITYHGGDQTANVGPGDRAGIQRLMDEVRGQIARGREAAAEASA